MGAKTWMLVYADADARKALAASAPLDREASARLAARLFPTERLVPMEDGSLSFTDPEDDVLVVGCFPGVSVLAASEFALDNPSTLQTRFLDEATEGTVYLHAMHSSVDWLALASWKNGRLVRALSLAPDRGIIEDIGERLPFEGEYWEGQHPVDDPEEDLNEEERYPLPFHPLELGEAALKEFFGYQLEGFVDDTLLDPESVPLLQFRRET